MNSITHETNSNNTHSGNSKKLLRLVGNNIKKQLFLHKLHDYKAQQKELLKASKKLITTHEKCIKFAKQTGSSKHKHIEEIEHVVISFSIN